LALLDRPLFDELFEAWVHGPVERKVYFKYHNKKSIYINADNIDRPPFEDEDSTKYLPEFLDDLLKIFLPIDGFDLECATHCEPPWIEAREGLDPDERSKNLISSETICSFFKSKVNE